MSDTILRMIIS